MADTVNCIRAFSKPLWALSVLKTGALFTSLMLIVAVCVVVVLPSETEIVGVYVPDWVDEGVQENVCVEAL